MASRTGLAAYLAAGSIAWCAPAWAQPHAPQDRQSSNDVRGPSSATLRAAFDAAWRRALGAAEAQADRNRAEAEREAARRPWAAPPALEIQQRDDRLQSNAGRRETEVGLAWPLWLPGQRAASGAVAQAAVDSAGGTERAARLQVAGAVREQGWRLIAANVEREQVAARIDVLRKLTADVERRVRAGDLARADALAARAELLAAEAKLTEVAQQADEARIRWHELTGLDAMPEAVAFAERIEVGDDGVEHPALALALRKVEQARMQLALVRTSSRDAPELKLGVRQDVSGGVEGTHNSVAVGVRIPFGTRDRQQPRVAAALGELDVAQRAEERLRARIRADIAAAGTALSAALSVLEAEQGRAHLLRERTSLIDRAFRAGEASLPELLRALAASAQAEGDAARHEIIVRQARSRLNQAIGLMP